MTGGLIERLARLDSCALSDAMDRLGLSGAVSGLEPRSARRRIAGRVLTVRLGPAEGKTASRHLCTTAIEAAERGDVIVIEQRTGIEAAGWGGILSVGAQAKGVAGVIVDGPARDIDEAVELGFPVYARSVTARTARGRIIEVATAEPIEVGGVAVSPGDYVIADLSGAVFVKAGDIARAVEAAERIAEREARMTKAAREGQPISAVMGADYERMLGR